MTTSRLFPDLTFDEWRERAVVAYRAAHRSSAVSDEEAANWVESTSHSIGLAIRALLGPRPPKPAPPAPWVTCMSRDLRELAAACNRAADHLDQLPS